MLEALHYEEFYDHGAWSDESLGVYVGWTVRKGSFCDELPISNEQNEIVMLFSGEEYSELRSRQQSQVCNHGTESTYLVSLYRKDPGFLQRLNGMFHGLVVDRRDNTLRLFNDRFGMHPLYYHESKDAFYFAAEAKAILAVRPELNTWDLQSMGDFVACSCILGNRTIFSGIHVLPAASSWTFRGARLKEKDQYFSPSEWEEQTPLGQEPYFDELRGVLGTLLPRYFSGSEKMGMAMTGGMDTRVILATQPPPPDSLPGYTFGSKFRDTYDVRIGKEVARLSRQSHQVIEVGDSFLSDFASHAERTVSITEGTVDLCRAPDLYLSQKVREIAPAKIVGTYGSEILRHAVMFKAIAAQPGLFTSDFLPYVRAAENTYDSLRQLHPVTFAAFRQSPWYHHGILALEQSQLTVHSPFMDNEFVRAAYRAPREAATDRGDVRPRLIKAANPQLGKIRSDRGQGGSGSQLGSFFARTYREFTFKAEYAYDMGMPQAVARIDHRLSSLRLERLFLGRHKLLHFRVWYRDQLADYVRQILLDPLTLSRPYLHKSAVETMVASHLTGTRNHTTELHKLLTLELIQRLFFEANRPKSGRPSVAAEQQLSPCLSGY